VGVLNGFGVIFVLDHRAFAIAKGSHHTEMLAVIMGRDAPDLDIPDRRVDWENDLMSAIGHRANSSRWGRYGLQGTLAGRRSPASGVTPSAPEARYAGEFAPCASSTRRPNPPFPWSYR
jgi:hypothetical protein